MTDNEARYIHTTLEELEDRKMIDSFVVGHANGKSIVVVKPNQ